MSFSVLMARARLADVLDFISWMDGWTMTTTMTMMRDGRQKVRISRPWISYVCMVRHNSIAEQCDGNTRNRSRERLESGVGTYLYSTHLLMWS